MKSNWFVMVAGVLVVPALAGAEPVTSSAPPGASAPVRAENEGAKASEAIEADNRGARSRLTFLLGLFTPTGEFGLEYTQNVASLFEVGVGVGGGFSGPQVSIMPRLRMGNGAVSLLLGAGLSGGPYHEPVLFCLSEHGGCMATETTAVWGNIEGGLQMVSRGGTTVTLYGGLGTMLGASGCTGPDCDDIVGTELPYGGIAIGHTL